MAEEKKLRSLVARGARKKADNEDAEVTRPDNDNEDDNPYREQIESFGFNKKKPVGARAGDGNGTPAAPQKPQRGSTNADDYKQRDSKGLTIPHIQADTDNSLLGRIPVYDEGGVPDTSNLELRRPDFSGMDQAAKGPSRMSRVASGLANMPVDGEDPSQMPGQTAQPRMYPVSGLSTAAPIMDDGGPVKNNPYDGHHQMAILEEGERVLTPRQNKAYEREHGYGLPKIYDDGGPVRLDDNGQPQEISVSESAGLPMMRPISEDGTQGGDETAGIRMLRQPNPAVSVSDSDQPVRMSPTVRGDISNPRTGELFGDIRNPDQSEAVVPGVRLASNEQPAATGTSSALPKIGAGAFSEVRPQEPALLGRIGDTTTQQVIDSQAQNPVAGVVAGQQKPVFTHEQLEGERSALKQKMMDAAEGKNNNGKFDHVAYGEAKMALADLNKAHPWGTPGSHEGFLGKIGHGLATAGELASDLVLGPGYTSMIPGTRENLNAQERQGMGQIKFGEEQKASEAETALKTAQAAHANDGKWEKSAPIYSASKPGELPTQIGETLIEPTSGRTKDVYYDQRNAPQGGGVTSGVAAQPNAAVPTQPIQRGTPRSPEQQPGKFDASTLKTNYPDLTDANIAGIRQTWEGGAKTAHDAESLYNTAQRLSDHNRAAAVEAQQREFQNTIRKQTALIAQQNAQMRQDMENMKPAHGTLNGQRYAGSVAELRGIGVDPKSIVSDTKGINDRSYGNAGKIASDMKVTIQSMEGANDKDLALATRILAPVHGLLVNQTLGPDFLNAALNSKDYKNLSPAGKKYVDSQYRLAEDAQTYIRSVQGVAGRGGEKMAEATLNQFPTTVKDRAGNFESAGEFMHTLRRQARDLPVQAGTDDEIDWKSTQETMVPHGKAPMYNKAGTEVLGYSDDNPEHTNRVYWGGGR